MTQVAVVALLAALVLGCSSERPPAPHPAPVAPAPAITAPRVDAAGTPDADACVAIRARFAQVLAARTDRCDTDADCACYNPVGGPDEGCGGVTDATTARALAAIEVEFHAAKCPWTHNCGAWGCAPTCDQHRCGP